MAGEVAVETDTTFLASLVTVSLATVSSLATDSFSLVTTSLSFDAGDESLLSVFETVVVLTYNKK